MRELYGAGAKTTSNQVILCSKDTSYFLTKKNKKYATHVTASIAILEIIHIQEKNMQK